MGDVRFGEDWQLLFVPCAHTCEAPSLGVDYVTASASSAALPLVGGESLEVNQHLSTLGIAGVVWNCARALLQYFQRHCSDELLQKLQGAHVLELGSGTGAVSLALAADQATFNMARITITDLPVVTSLIQENIAHGARQSPQIAKMKAEGCLTARAYEWGASITSLKDAPHVVLGSDCLYEPRLYPALLTSLKQLGSSERSVILLAYKPRHVAAERQFFSEASNDFRVQILVNTKLDTPHAFQFGKKDDDRVFICQLTRQFRPEGENATM